MKTIYKPWGKEVWLELNDKYCYKRIYINQGTRTSFQYHEKKLETNYIISGIAEIWLENDLGEIEKTTMTANDFFTVVPPRKHRVIALTDLVLQEVSTPEVDDVIRIEDDAQRNDGRIDYEHQKNAACILTAGTGRRMANLSDIVNKGLLPLDNKAIISHMIEKVPEDFDIIIALGYKKETVKEYCLAAHPERKFIFVDVGDFEGQNTGPSYSIDKCKKHLQRPFYFMTCDAFIEEALPALKDNWLGVSPTSIPELYATVSIKDGDINSFKNKDKLGHENAFIGVASIYDFNTFWEQLDVESGEIVSAFYDIEKYSNFRGKYLTWYDLGTIDNYVKARSLFNDTEKLGILKFNGEFVYKVNNNFIKMCNNTKSVSNKIRRHKILSEFTPDLKFTGKHIYSYDFIAGKTLYELDDIDVFKNFLDFANKNLWIPCDDVGTLAEQCENFYRDKSISRLQQFLLPRDESYVGNHSVNGVQTKDIHSLLEDFDWNQVCNNFIPTTTFHGDLQFDNIIYTPKEKFYLIDWRQEFGGSTTIGDVYYDLAKLYGGTLISYSLMKEESNFTMTNKDRKISYEHKKTVNLCKFASFYEQWIIEHGYDLSKVKKITALIFLNMAPLHSKEFGDFLFFNSKIMLEGIDDK